MAGIPHIMPYPLPSTSDLPDNVATWVADPSRTILLVHDMQKYFLRPFPDSVREEVVRNAESLLTRCREQGVPIAYTTQPGDMTEDQRGLLKDFWGPGMKADPVDREVVAALAPAPTDWMFTKWRYSAFFRSDLLSRMRESGRDQIVLCGVYAHVGVLATAMEAFTNDIQPFVVADATADFSGERHRQALEYLAQRCAVVVMTAEVFR